MKRLFLMSALMLTIAAHAQRIDFDANANQDQSTQPGYEPWLIYETVSAEKEFDGVTITISTPQGADPENNVNDIRHIKTEWFKTAITSGNDGCKLIGDALIVTGDDHSYITSGSTQIDIKIEGLSAGRHSLQAYHNVVEFDEKNGIAPDIDVYVNGTKVLTGVKQSLRKSLISESGMSYIEFDAVAGEPVVISYVSTPDPSVTNYGRTYCTINGLMFNTSDNSKIALDPIPNENERHAGDGEGNVTMSWTAPATAVKHHVYIGTDKENLSLVATVTSPTYTAENLSNLKDYYWRIDEEEADGTVTTGEVWMFRPAHLAFPGAEGYGKYAIGGRGGVVYHVTNLEDNGDDENPIPGSLRYGIKKVEGPRTIVFDVAGVIDLKSRLTCSDKFVTIAGQTAPGNGIMLRTSAFGMQSDGITRFIRMRLGHKKLINGVIPGTNNGYSYGSEEGTTQETTLGGLDGMGMAGNDHAIMDHCSISWTIDEAFSSRSGKGLTLQRTLISEALNRAGHPNYSSGTNHGYAATIGGGEMGGRPASYHHNLLAHCEGRNWSISGGLDGGGSYDGHHDIYNNVVYNYGSRATDGGTHQMNFCNNYYKMGANSTSTIMRLQLEGTGTGTQSVYVNGNIRQEKNNGKLTEDAKGVTYTYTTSGGQVVDWDPLPTTPFDFLNPEGNMETAQAAFKNVLSDVGCNQPFFDYHDQRMVTESKNGTTSTKGSRTGRAGLIDSEEDAGCEGFDLEKLGIIEASRDADWDTDQDGMPDWFEKLKGTNPNVTDNNEDPDDDGYTNLEDYLNWVALPNFLIEEESKTVGLAEYFAGYNNPTYTVVSGNNATISNGNLVVTITDSTPNLFSVQVQASEDGISLTRQFNFATENITNGIATVGQDTPATDANAPIYNLAGQQVTKSYKGVVIQNGHKFIQK